MCTHCLAFHTRIKFGSVFNLKLVAFVPDDFGKYLGAEFYATKSFRDGTADFLVSTGLLLMKF